MRNLAFLLAVGLVVFMADQSFAQSGSRGSGSRGGGARPAPRSSFGGGGPQGRPSRTGGARPSAVPQRAAPSGILGTVGNRPSGPAPGGPGPRAGAGSRIPSTGIRSGSPSYGSGSYSSPTTGVSAPKKRRRRTPRKTSASNVNSQATATPANTGRIWTDSTGTHSIRGEMAAYQNGIVWIRRTDGLISKLSVNQLSAMDRSHLQSLGN